jgi:hypothetical protein
MYVGCWYLTGSWVGFAAVAASFTAVSAAVGGAGVFAASFWLQPMEPANIRILRLIVRRYGVNFISSSSFLQAKWVTESG